MNNKLYKISMNDDRFEKLSHNYGELFTEVFAEEGFDYGLFEISAFDAVSKSNPDTNNPVLDIGTGDGETIVPFVRAGYKNLTGIDLNQQMLESARRKLGDSVNWVLMNAIDMSEFKEGQFGAIITGMSIHNISKEDRKLLWKEILRLSPDIFVAAEKVSDDDPIKHAENLKREIDAVKKVYGKKHGLKQAEQEWLDHYKYDEKERLELSEIRNALEDKYYVDVVFEMGLGKTVVARKKIMP